MKETKKIEYDMSDVEVFCVGEIDINEYIRNKVIESMKKEENSVAFIKKGNSDSK